MGPVQDRHPKTLAPRLNPNNHAPIRSSIKGTRMNSLQKQIWLKWSIKSKESWSVFYVHRRPHNGWASNEACTAAL